MPFQLMDTSIQSGIVRGQRLLASPQVRAALGFAVVSACMAALAPPSAEAAPRRGSATVRASAPPTCGNVAGATLQFGDNTISNIVCSGLRARTPLTFLSSGPDLTFGIARPTRGASISYTIATRQPSSQVFGSVGLNSSCATVGNPSGTCTFTTKVMDDSGREIRSLTSTNGAGVSPFSLTSDHTVLNILNTFNSTGRAAVFGAITTLSQRGLTTPPTVTPPPNAILPGPTVLAPISIEETPLEDIATDPIPTGTTPPANNTTDGFNGTADGASVPGPLPLLGGAAAFGFSRRIRARIRRSASQA